MIKYILNKLKWLIPIFVLFSFQNCEVGLKMGDIESITNSLKSNSDIGGGHGNGVPYEGKIVTYKRLVPTESDKAENIDFQISNKCNEKELETIKLIRDSYSINRLDLHSCNRINESTISSQILLSKNKLLLSYQGGLFIDSNYLDEKYPNYMAQTWCQSSDNTDVAFDFLVLVDSYSGKKLANLFLKNLHNDEKRAILDFEVQNSISENNHQLSYFNNSFQIKIDLDRPQTLTLGNYSAKSLFSVDNKIYKQNFNCILGHYYDNAFWPSKPLFSEKGMYIELPNNNISSAEKNKKSVLVRASNYELLNQDQSIIYSINDEDYTDAIIYKFLIKTKEKINLNISNKIGFPISTWKISQDQRKMLIRSNGTDPNRFIIYDLETKNKIFESKDSIQVTDFGESNLGIWYKGFEFHKGKNNDYIYLSGENYYYPMGITNSNILLPNHDSIIQLDLADINVERNYLLYSVQFGERLSIRNNYWTLGEFDYLNPFNDLAVYDTQTQKLFQIKLYKKIPNFHLGSYLSDMRKSLAIVGSDIYAVMQSTNKKYEYMLETRLVKYNLQSNQVHTVLNLKTEHYQSHKNGLTQQSIQIFNKKVFYLDERNMYQVLDLVSGKINPIVSITENQKIVPLTFYKDYLLYFKLNEQQQWVPQIWDTKKPIEQGPIFKFDNVGIQVTKKTSNEKPFNSNFVFNVNKSGKMLFMMDTDHDLRTELYFMDLQKEENGINMINDNYSEYGSIVDFKVSDDNQIFLISQKNNITYWFQWNYK